MFARCIRVAPRKRRQRRCSSGSSNFRTNAGIVEGAWIFCRHGDRAPSRSLSPEHCYEREADFWARRLPHPETFRTLSGRFPVDVHPCNDGEYLDSKRVPFGWLTETGIEQTQKIGKSLFNRYNRHGHHLPGKERFQNSKDFLDAWDVRVFSTNYLRTVLSAQSFLDGLLKMKCYESLDLDRQEQQQQNMYGPTLHANSARRRIEVPTHESTAAIDESDALQRVQIRSREEDTLNAFDRNPELMADLVAEVISSPEFRDRDGHAAPLAARLANILPGLARKRAVQNVYNTAPSGINWIEASDHFVCRAAHGVPLSEFSDFEHDDRVERTLSALAHPTTAHLTWRFRQWYKNPRLLAAIAAPALREIANELTTAPLLGTDERHPFTLYSCHDVTILALLYAIGSDFLADDDSGGWRFWPKYASTLVFELVRITEDGMPPSHVIRVLLNGSPIRSVDLHNNFWDGPSAPIGNGPKEMLMVEDFARMVDRLERAGGYDRGALHAADQSTERDMSNWTG